MRGLPCIMTVTALVIVMSVSTTAADAPQRSCKVGSVYTTATMPGGDFHTTTPDDTRAAVDVQREGHTAKQGLYLALTEVLARVDAAWNLGEARAFAAEWTPCGTVVNPFGGLTEGRADIERVMAIQFAGPSKGTTHLLEIARVYWVSPSVAVAEGTATVVPGDGSEVWPAPFTAIFSRNRYRKWQIAHMRGYVFLQH